MSACEVSTLNRGKERKVNSLVLLMPDSSCYKPPPMSSPITSWSLFSFTMFFFFLVLLLLISTFSLLFFPCHSQSSSLSSVQYSISLYFPSSSYILMSPFANVKHEHHCTMFKHLRKKETYLQVLLSDIQEHEKALTVPLTCQKAVKP